MRTLFISPSYKCNERCVFCPCSVDSSSYASLSLEEATAALDEALAAGQIEMVLISGGEPTLWKPLFRFIAELNRRGLKWGMLSNSTAFSSRSFAERFLEVAGTDFELTTAFHSHMEAAHEKITRLPGSFGKSLQGVLNLVEKGVKVTVKHVINNLSYSLLPEYATWVAQTFPASMPIVICNMDICGVAEKNMEMTGVRFEDSRKYLEEALDILGETRIVRVFNTPLCCVDPYYWRFMQKYESEEQMTALMLPAKTNEEARIRFNLKGDGGPTFEVCRECTVRQICPGTWKRTIELLGEETLKAF